MKFSETCGSIRHHQMLWDPSVPQPSYKTKNNSESKDQDAATAASATDQSPTIWTRITRPLFLFYEAMRSEIQSPSAGPSPNDTWAKLLLRSAWWLKGNLTMYFSEWSPYFPFISDSI